MGILFLRRCLPSGVQSEPNMSRMDRMATSPNCRLGSPLEALSWNLIMNSQKVCCEASAPVKNWFPLSDLSLQVPAPLLFMNFRPLARQFGLPHSNTGSDSVVLGISPIHARIEVVYPHLYWCWNHSIVCPLVLPSSLA